jgi:uncharacterized protein YjbI with pentapeptide repeats
MSNYRKTTVGKREISEKEITKILKNHKKWLESDRKEGIQADLRGANLSGKNLSGENLSEANIIDADLSEANLSRVNLSEAKLSRAYLRGANLLKAKFVRTNFECADLCGVNLSGENLYESKFGAANLVGVNFSGANLSLVDFSYANLSGTNLSKAYLSEANFNRADLSKANLAEANLSMVSFVETNLEGTNLSNSIVYGISAWNLKANEKTNQLSLVITQEGEPVISVDDIEVAQFIYLLISHKNLRKVINSVTQKGVLILGRFGGGGIDILRAIADKLTEMKYLPIIFDFERPQNRNYTETIKTLAGLSRFVIVDLSGPSVPQELYATVPHFKIPFVPIMEHGKRPYAMFADILEYDWVLKPIIEFDTRDSLINSLPSRIVYPAEEKHKKRQELLRELFGE